MEHNYRGQPPKYSDPAMLRSRIDEYFDMCEAKSVFPDEAGMMLYLKVRKADIERLTDDSNPKCEAVRNILEDAMLRRKSALMRKMVTDPKAANGCMNALKQLENGGLTDKPFENMDKTVHVKVAETDEELFK